MEIYKKKKELPTAKKLTLKTKIDELTTGKKIVRHAITPQYIRDFEFDFRLIPNPQNPASIELDKALEIQFQQTILALHGDLVDRKELAAQLISKFGRDPAKILKEEAFAPPLMPEQGGAATMIPNTGGDNSANIIKGGTGVGEEAMMTRRLMEGMSGK